MVYELRKQSMPWMETDCSKHTHFRWKIKWRLEHLGALGITGETAPLSSCKEKARKKIWGSWSIPLKPQIFFWAFFATALKVASQLRRSLSLLQLKLSKLIHLWFKPWPHFPWKGIPHRISDQSEYRRSRPPKCCTHCSGIDGAAPTVTSHHACPRSWRHVHTLPSHKQKHICLKDQINRHTHASVGVTVRTMGENSQIAVLNILWPHLLSIRVQTMENCIRFVFYKKPTSANMLRDRSR